MRTQLKRLTILCASTLLLACADLGIRPPGQRTVSADDAYVAGRTLHLAHRFDEAALSYGAALRVDPGHVNASNGLATIYAERGDVARAIALWRELTDSAPASAGPGTAFLYSNLGYAYFLAGKYESALAALERACVLDPRNHRAWRHLGGTLEKLGQGERAQAMYKQASALEAHDLTADYGLAQRNGIAAIDSAVAAKAASPWPATEVVQTASGIFELRRVGAPAAVHSAAMQATSAAPGAPALPATKQDRAKLEIRNGNGVVGMARSLARNVGDDKLRVVRLSNQKGFGVKRTRIEYQSAFRDAADRLAERVGGATVVEVDNCKSADMRLVIGRDLILGKAAPRPGARAALAVKVARSVGEQSS
jgi:Flp pilus assembly protein TadD